MGISNPTAVSLSADEVRRYSRHLVLPEIGLEGFVAMMIFLLILVVGFVYEWKKGALEWE